MTQSKDAAIPCWIYRSSRKDEMYLYLAQEDHFEEVPQPLLDRFGQPVRVMELELHPGRELAREDVTKVMASLREQGFYLQIPPDIQAKLYRGD